MATFTPLLVRTLSARRQPVPACSLGGVAAAEGKAGRITYARLQTVPSPAAKDPHEPNGHITLGSAIGRNRVTSDAAIQDGSGSSRQTLELTPLAYLRFAQTGLMHG
jgi:hypothetical protein